MDIKTALQKIGETDRLSVNNIDPAFELIADQWFDLHDRSIRIGSINVINGDLTINQNGDDQ